MRLRRLLILGSVLALSLGAFIVGAYLAVHKEARKVGCAYSAKTDAKPRAIDSVPANPLRGPLSDAKVTSAASLPGPFTFALTELAKQYGAELETWDSVAAHEAIRDLYFLRRPKILKNEEGRMVGYEVESTDQLADNALDDIFDPNATPPSTRRALDRIDLLIEEKFSKPGGAAELISFLGEPLPATTDASTTNFLRAARVRAILALRDVKLNDDASAQMTALMKNDDDPLSRGAAAAAVLAQGGEATVRDWLRAERNSRAVEALLADLARSRSVRDALLPNPSDIMGSLRPQPKAGEALGVDLRDLVFDEARGASVRGAAARALGARITIPWVVPTLLHALTAESSEDARKAIIYAMANATSDTSVERTLLEVARTDARGLGERAASLEALGRSSAPTVLETLVQFTCAGPKELRVSACAGLITKKGRLLPQQRQALRNALDAEADPDIRTLLELVAAGQ